MVGPCRLQCGQCTAGGIIPRLTTMMCCLGGETALCCLSSAHTSRACICLSYSLAITAWQHAHYTGQKKQWCWVRKGQCCHKTAHFAWDMAPFCDVLQARPDRRYVIRLMTYLLIRIVDVLCWWVAKALLARCLRAYCAVPAQRWLLLEGVRQGFEY